MPMYNFKKIQVVPSSGDFIDIVLSRTQRKTPTVIHKNYQISRIRSFYMRKVKFTQETFDEKLVQILSDFPKLDDIHPFYADLLNVLYDRDHYKLALGQIHAAKNLIDNVGRDYVRLMKFGDSLYRCKQLKRAALGRMATIMKRHKETLAYLEQVRQHLGRLPSIDPNTRTLLICGYPNVGKSSFINKLTRAEVDVQPYAFTTKSLFVGHMDYKYLRWQVIDTPGILDHPLEERNTIEMLSITALAHLRSCILYFMDLSEQCGYSISDQVKLFHNIKPLFANKPLILLINKIDQRRLDDLSADDRALVEDVMVSVTSHAEISCHHEIGLMEARNLACEKLLAYRVENKVRSGKVESILQRIHVAQPMERDDIERPPFIPTSVAARRNADGMVEENRILAKDTERMNGGPGVFNINLKDKYMLSSDEWKNDVIPEILDGHNITDFIDPDIESKLEALEREEEDREQSGAYLEKLEEPDEETLAIRSLSKRIQERKKLIIQAHRMGKGKNRPSIPQKVKSKFQSLETLSGQLADVGLETSQLENVSDARGRRKRSRSIADSVVFGSQQTSFPGMSRSVSRVRDRSEMGLRNVKQKLEATNIKRKAEKARNLDARKGEADRVVLASRPKHLMTGKRGMGKTDRR